MRGTSCGLCDKVLETMEDYDEHVEEVHSRTATEGESDE